METVSGFSLGDGNQKRWERSDRRRKAVVEKLLSRRGKESQRRKRKIEARGKILATKVEKHNEGDKRRAMKRKGWR